MSGQKHSVITIKSTSIAVTCRRTAGFDSPSCFEKREVIVKHRGFLDPERQKCDLYNGQMFTVQLGK